MKERLSTREKGKRFIAAGTLSALAVLGISSCSEKEDISWRLAVDCPDGKELTVRNYKRSGPVNTFEMSCDKNGVPSSIRIIDSPQFKNGEKDPTSGFDVDISATRYTGILDSNTPILTTKDDADNGYTEVELTYAGSLGNVNITRPEDKK